MLGVDTNDEYSISGILLLLPRSSLKCPKGKYDCCIKRELTIAINL